MIKRGILFMKIIKNTIFIAILLFGIVSISHTMDQKPQPETKKPSRTQRIVAWAQLAGNIMLGNIPVRRLIEQTIEQSGEPFPFAELPKNIQVHIIDLLSINTTAESLDVAAYTINSLAHVNKSLNALINDPLFCLQLVTYFSRKLNRSHWDVCKALNTQEAKRRLALQEQFENMVINKTLTQEKLYNLLRQGFDLNFTYESGATALTACIFDNNVTAVELLLNAGADPEARNQDNTTASTILALFSRDTRIKKLIENKIKEKNKK
jgi:hypothetical protein